MGCLWVTHIIKKFIAAARQAPDLLHIFVDNCRNFQIVSVGRFPTLEIDVGILGGTPQFRSFRICTSGSKIRYSILVNQFGHILVFN